MQLHGPAADGQIAGDQTQRRHRVAGGVDGRDERQVDGAARPGVAAEDEGDERHRAGRDHGVPREERPVGAFHGAILTEVVQAVGRPWGRPADAFVWPGLDPPFRRPCARTEILADPDRRACNSCRHTSQIASPGCRSARRAARRSDAIRAPYHRKTAFGRCQRVLARVLLRSASASMSQAHPQVGEIARRDCRAPADVFGGFPVLPEIDDRGRDLVGHDAFR